MAEENAAPEMNPMQQESAHEKIDQLEQKISVYNEQAEKLGEDGKIDEAEALLEEIEKFKRQKTELEALIDHNLANKDKNMKVCEVCGALQSALDTDKRLTMHLEGKLHTGYLKIRQKLAELKKQGRRERSRSPPRPIRKDRNAKPAVDAADSLFDQKIIFSSRKLGSGSNIPSGITTIKFSAIAIQQNQGYSRDDTELGITNLGKEWRWYKKELETQRRRAKHQAERVARDATRGNDRPPARDYSRDDRSSYRRDDRRDQGSRHDSSRDHHRSSYGGSSYGGSYRR